MTTNSSKLSTTEAAKIIGCSRRHVQNLIKKGTLSAARDESQSYVIDKSELYRVFPHKFKGNEENESEKNTRVFLEQEIEHLKQILDEKIKLIDFLNALLAQADTEKRLLLETLNSNQKLLEHNIIQKKKKLLGIF